MLRIIFCIVQKFKSVVIIRVKLLDLLNDVQNPLLVLTRTIQECISVHFNILDFHIVMSWSVKKSILIKKVTYAL